MADAANDHILLPAWQQIMPNAEARANPGAYHFSATAFSRLLVIGLFIVGCDSDKPTQMQTSELAAANLVQALPATVQQGIVAAQAGAGLLPGVSGEFSVVGDRWRFDRYSPAGEVFIDGELTVDAEQQPMVIRGELDLSGALSGVLFIDLSYNSSNGVFDGAITVDGIRVAVSERLCCVN